jgi:hypothetical protein
MCYLRHEAEVAEGGAAEQADAADEGRLEASGAIMVGKVIEDEGKVVRPSQLIRRVLRTCESSRHHPTHDAI